jgi:carbamoyltransferase
MKVAEMSEVRDVRFMPSCGDESNPFGAAYHEYIRETGKLPEPLHDIFLGPTYTNDEIAKYIERHGIGDEFIVVKHDNIEDRIGELLANFHVVARFAGRAEWGARSLGNRAILANPSSLESFYEVNDAIKVRDFWMPFAPSILESDADRYIINPKGIKAPHMILGFHSTPLAKEHLRAAMHQADKTVRPQIVTEDGSPKYAKVIRAFKERTGIGAVMNTSFNMHGYPLVSSLDQAFFTFRNSGLKHMTLENYLISKQ